VKKLVFYMNSPAELGLTAPGCPPAEKSAEKKVRAGDNCRENET
jgi:hypothetical protein